MHGVAGVININHPQTTHAPQPPPSPTHPGVRVAVGVQQPVQLLHHVAGHVHWGHRGRVVHHLVAVQGEEQAGRALLHGADGVMVLVGRPLAQGRDLDDSPHCWG